MIPYTYLAIHKKTGLFYYGLRMSNKLPPKEDIGIVYFTSSDTVKKIIKAEGADAFFWSVRKEFKTKEEAAWWEYKVLRRMMKHPKILNRGISPRNVPGNWFTNGKDNILGKYCPKGYWSGRTMSTTENRKKLYERQKKNKWWNNGDKCVFTEFKPDPSWVSGRLKEKHNLRGSRALTGTEWWTDGKTNYRGIKPPEGFKRGRAKFLKRKKRPPFTEKWIKEHSEKMSKKRWWQNGKECVFANEPPSGFYPGRIMKNKTKQPS